MTIKLGIIGAGRITRFHLQVFADLPVELVAIANKTKEKAEILAKEFSIPKVYDNYKTMIKDTKLDAVGIFTSVETIFPITMYVINKKISCLIEKPPGLSIKEARSLEDCAKNNNVKVMVGLNRRYMSTIQKAKEMIKGDILKTIIIEAPERFETIKEYGKYSQLVLDSWIYANGIHCIDLFTFFAGEAKDVISYSKENDYNALITFQNEVVGQYYSNWDCPGNWSITLITNNRKVIILPLEEGTSIAKSHEKTEFKLSEIDEKYKPGFYLQGKEFIESILEKRPIQFPGCDIHEAIKTMELINKIDKKFISSPPDERL